MTSTPGPGDSSPDEVGDDPWAVFVAGPPVTGREIASRWTALAGRALRVPLAVVTGLVLLGAPVGLLAARLSPRVSVSFSAQGPALEQPESSQFFTVDTSFLLWLFAAGLLAGAVAWRFLRDNGVGAAVGLAVGGLLAGTVAHAVAVRVIVDERLARLCAGGSCDVYDGTQPVRALVYRVQLFEGRQTTVYLGGIACAIAALVMLVVLALFVDRESASVS